jgi:hypothetical protein
MEAKHKGMIDMYFVESLKGEVLAESQIETVDKQIL